MNAKEFRDGVLGFVKARQCENGYEFTYTDTIEIPVHYNTLYAEMKWHMFDELGNISGARKKEIARYITSFQCDDGLFRDPRLDDSPVKLGEGWGWTHLTQHAIMALWALGEKTDKPFDFLDPFFDLDYTRRWLEAYAQIKMWDMGNAVMYRTNMLQAQRKWFDDGRAQGVIDCVLDFLDQTQDPGTGMWREDLEYSPGAIARAVQISYHLWELFFHERRPLKYGEKIIDGVLWTQNSLGGYSPRADSYGCEDIDSIVPLVRMYHEASYRQAVVEDSLRRAFPWVMTNRNSDGGFVNIRNKSFIYGHPLMKNEANQSDIFATWWRCLSLAYLSRVVHNDVLDGVNWQFMNGPGYSSWHGD